MVAIIYEEMLRKMERMKARKEYVK